MTKSDSRSLNFPNLSYIKTDSSPLYVFVFPTTEERICICLYPNVYFVFWLEIKFFWQVLWGRVQLGRDKSQCHTPGTTSSPLLPIILLCVSLYLLKRYSHVWNKVKKKPVLSLGIKIHSAKILCWSLLLYMHQILFAPTGALCRFWQTTFSFFFFKTVTQDSNCGITAIHTSPCVRTTYINSMQLFAQINATQLTQCKSPNLLERLRRS